MILQHFIDQRPWLFPHPEQGGQVFFGEAGHIRPSETPTKILECMKAVLVRKHPDVIFLWEIQAEEKSGNNWS